MLKSYVSIVYLLSNSITKKNKRNQILSFFLFEKQMSSVLLITQTHTFSLSLSGNYSHEKKNETNKHHHLSTRHTEKKQKKN